MKIAPAGVRRFLKAPEPNVRAVLLFGPNRARIAEASQELIKAWAGRKPSAAAVTRLTDDDLKSDKAALADALFAQSLLGEASVVRVRLDADAAAASVIAALADIEAGAATNPMVVESYSATTKSAITKAFEKAANAAMIAFYEDAPEDLDAYARELAQEFGLQIAPDALASVRASVADDRAALRRELEKSALFAHDLGRPMTSEDVGALLGDAAAQRLDAVCRAAVEGDAAGAIEAYERLEDANPIVVLKALERRLLQLMDIRLQVDRGAQPAAAAKALRPPPIWKDVQPLADQSRLWRRTNLTAALDTVWRCEQRCKRAGAPQFVLTAMCVRTIAALARRGG